MSWPRLTETLGGPIAPNRCQSCGRCHEERNALARFQECDDRDQGEQLVVVLCRLCSERLVEKHPRLYRQLEDARPWPGCMGVCLSCRHREGVTCTSPASEFNGGAGHTFEPKPQLAHIRCTRRYSGSRWICIGKRVERCSGFEPQPTEAKPCATA